MNNEIAFNKKKKSTIRNNALPYFFIDAHHVVFPLQQPRFLGSALQGRHVHTPIRMPVVTGSFHTDIPQRMAIQCMFRNLSAKKVAIFRLFPISVHDMLRIPSPVNFWETFLIAERKVRGFDNLMAIVRDLAATTAGAAGSRTERSGRRFARPWRPPWTAKEWPRRRRIRSTDWPSPASAASIASSCGGVPRQGAPSCSPCRSTTRFWNASGSQWAFGNRKSTPTSAASCARFPRPRKRAA